ncbi:MAG TPA: sigma-70 family RNA polymerase sigma factor [Verrucomicrobiae bacterium]|nr:sigma-70 family RNA polymerase sigma factor [Verrucomicrobiae bacterium]
MSDFVVRRRYTFKSMTSDLDLLRQYTRENSQDAFAEIVRRHLDLVHSAALRQVRSPQLAEEVSQSVFADLARDAGKIGGTGVPPVSSLTPWLYAVTRRTAIDVIRKESRRQLREQIAVEMNNMNATESGTGVPPVWFEIEPLLDEAMDTLDDADRSAILLRYFENKNLREVGEVLGASEGAAQKRVSRAVERLREFFSKRSVTIGASGLAVLISANAVQAAPVGLAASISTAAVLAGAAVHTSAVIAATKAIAMTTIQKTLFIILGAAAVGATIYAFQLQNQIHSLRQKQTTLTEQIQQLQQERDEATNQLASLQQENKQLRANETELLRLRGEMTQLRRQQNALPVAAQTETNSVPEVEKIQILLRAQFVSLPTENLQVLGVGWKSDAHGVKTGLLTGQQFKVINEALQGASDANVISAPRIVTINGEQAQISVTKAFPVLSAEGTNANASVNYTNIGVNLDVKPYFSTNSSTFNLNLGAKLNQLTGDPSQPDVQTIQLTNQVTLSPGQTVVMATEMADDGWMPGSTNMPAGPKSLLMFVTPTVVDGRDFPKRQ